MAYRSRNFRVEGRDINLVRKIWRQNDLSWALGHFQSLEWVGSMIGNIMHRIVTPPTVPRPLSARSRSPQAKRRPMPLQAKQMPKQKAQARPSMAPTPKWSPGQAASSMAAAGDTAVGMVEEEDTVADVFDADTEPTVHRPQSIVRRSAHARAMADVLVDRTPSPSRGRRLAWTCESCGNLNNRTSLLCSRAGCTGRLPQRLQAGDWECLQCGHKNRRWRERCNWSHCPSNDWVCPSCQNLNYGDRRFCNGRDPPCTEPRPRSLR